MGSSVAVLGASGYAGGELLRLLAAHPALTVTVAGASSRAGEPLAAVHPQLAGIFDLDLVPAADACDGVDVCFSCLPHGVLPDLLDSVDAGLLVDLADDFRADASWTYGLPELDRDRHRGSTRISNPGCYPTATLLCLVPLARAGLLGPSIVVDAMSGVSGAGRAPRDGLLFSTLDGSVAAYGDVHHRHVPEMERGLAGFGGRDASVSFTPHLVPTTRGLLVTARSPWLGGDGDDPLEVLRAAYAGEPFVEVIEGWPSTKAVAGTNRAHVSARVDARNGLVICSAAIDNLGKGAAGQAIQNANLALGLEETLGLEVVAAWP